MSESNKIEKEVNFKVIDQEGLKNYLQSACMSLGLTKIGFDYFDNSADPTMYARIETVNASDEKEQLYLTVKRKIEGEGPVSKRHEVTIEINNKDDVKVLLEILGLSYINSKGKIRESYEHQGLRIDVDSRFDEKFESYVETRIEIEGEDDESIMEFSRQISSFTEQ